MNTHFNPFGHHKIDERYVKYDEQLQHNIYVPPDDGEPISFKWVVQRGILQPRMSGYELADFVINGIVAIIGMGLFRKHPRVEAEFLKLLRLLINSPKEKLDRLLPWIRVERYSADADMIILDLNSKVDQKSGKVYFV